MADKTFAPRLLWHLRGLFPRNGKYPSFTSQIDEEEYEYLCRSACTILKEDVENMNPEDEWYYRNLCNSYKTYVDIIEQHICYNYESFFNYLKAIKAI